MKNFVLVYILFITACCVACKNPTPQNPEAIKAAYLQQASKTFKGLNKEDSQIILGHLNEDQDIDAVIQYPIYEGGNRAVAYHLIVVLANSQSQPYYLLYEPDFCPKIENIANKKINLQARSSCIEPNPKLLAKHQLQIKEDEQIKDEIIWSYKTPIIQLLNQLKTDLQNKDSIQLKNKYQFDFSPYSDNKTALPQLLSILNNNNLQALKKADKIEAQQKIKDEEQTYTIEILNNKISLLLFLKALIPNENFTDEALLKFDFEMQNKKLVFKDFMIAG